MIQFDRSKDRRRPLGKARSFWIMVRGQDPFERANYRLVRAAPIIAGQHCVVYLDELDGLSDRIWALAKCVVETFDFGVCPAVSRWLGSHRDVDDDGRLAIVLSSCLESLCDGAVSVGGFVRPSDFVPQIGPPAGNRCDSLYLNSRLRPGPHLQTILAHEYVHAVAFSQRCRAARSAVPMPEEDWLNEAIAYVAEGRLNYSWSNRDYRLAAFLDSPQQYSLVVPDYAAAGLWRSHGHRGAAYLFLAWCADHFGYQLLKELVLTERRGVGNVERATGWSFPELFRAWSLATFLAGWGMSPDRAFEYSTVPLRAAVGDYLLAGPCYRTVDLCGGAVELNLAGTSACYLILHSSEPVVSRVRLRA